MPRRNAYKLLIFDWDGTLINSESSIVTCMKLAMRDVGLPILSSDEIKNIIGLGLYEALVKLFPSANNDQYQHLIERYRVHFLAMEQAIPFEGVKETLAHLYERGYLLAVATGKGRAGLNKALKHVQFQQFFHATRCADETRSKPHPQMVNELLEELEVTPDNALMVGDTEYDLEMAQNAGVDGVAVSYGVHDIERLHQYKPVVKLDKLSEIIPWLDRNSKNLP